MGSNPTEVELLVLGIFFSPEVLSVLVEGESREASWLFNTCGILYTTRSRILGSIITDTDLVSRLCDCCSVSYSCVSLAATASAQRWREMERDGERVGHCLREEKCVVRGSPDPLPFASLHWRWCLLSCHMRWQETWSGCKNKD